MARRSLLLPIAAAFGLAALMTARFLPVRADDGIRVISASALKTPEESEAAARYASRLIVQFKDQVDDRLAERCVSDAGAWRASRSQFGRRYVVEPMAGLSLNEMENRFRSMAEVDFVERDAVVRAHFSPNDQFYARQWHLRMLGAERMWDIQRGDPSVAVAVLDTGVAYEDFGPFRKAPDFGGTVFLPGFNVFTRDTHANDDNFHGTHVASIIAEATNNGTGVSGLAHLTAIMPVKVLDKDGFGSTAGIAEGIDYVVNFRQNGVNPVRVINLSLGGSAPSPSMASAIDKAVAAGITVVASSGNDNLGIVDYPAAFENVIAVGSIDARKVKAPYSNFGSALDLVAPGGDNRRDDTADGAPDGVLQQTFNPDAAALGRYDDFGFYYVVGTSQAAPQVAALAALLARQGIKDPKAIQAIMERTAEDLGNSGRDDTFGFGLIRPSEALKGLGLSR